MLARGIVISVFVSFAAVFFLTALCGKKYVASGTTEKDRDDRLLQSHKVCARGAFIIMTLAIATLELTKVLHGALGNGVIRTMHLAFIIPFLFLFLSALFLFTGERTPRIHYFLVYPCIAFFVAAFIAGTAMLLGVAQ